MLPVSSLPLEDSGGDMRKIIDYVLLVKTLESGVKAFRIERSCALGQNPCYSLSLESLLTPL